MADDYDYYYNEGFVKANLAIVKYLVSFGADINAEDNYAVCCAAGDGQLEVVKYLVSEDEKPLTKEEMRKARLLFFKKV